MSGMKRYLKDNVYQALQKRFEIIFNEFDNILLAFSGGKDSGLLLNLAVKYAKENGYVKKIGVFHQDFEAQYSETTLFVERTMTSNLDIIAPYWSCMPMKCKTATSMFEQYWIPWECEKREIWVREMPQYDSVININNHRFDFYKYAMMQEDFYAAFTPWFHGHERGGHGKTICLTGVRAQESLNRWRAITHDKGTYKDIPWTTCVEKDVYVGHPLYDWTAEDIWIANAKFGFDYNKLYDLFYYAGLSVHQMRVASPFNDWAIGSLKLYRAIEPNVWGKMVGRVNGANFCAIYGESHAVAWKNIKLPKGHTWKTYVEFLMKTLPEDTRKTYEGKFATSIKFWREKGGVLSEETIRELREIGVPIEVKGKTNYKTDNIQVAFEEYPDDLDVKEFQTVPSYKRMAICILKNDHLCKYMGFSQTKKEAERRRVAIEKYKNL